MPNDKPIPVRMNSPRRAPHRAAPWLFALAVLLTGCKTTTTPESNLPTKPLMGDNRSRNGGQGSLELGDATDPCAMRMHDLIGPIYQYFVLHRELPAQLEDVRDLADLDQPVDFSCPVSGKPYVYVRRGLLDPAMSRRLIIYDPTPAHFLIGKDKDGKDRRVAVRWGIVTTEPRPGTPILMNAVHLTEQQFRTYVPDVPEVIVPSSTGQPIPTDRR